MEIVVRIFPSLFYSSQKFHGTENVGAIGELAFVDFQTWKRSPTPLQTALRNAEVAPPFRHVTFHGKVELFRYLRISSERFHLIYDMMRLISMYLREVRVRL